MKQTTNIESKIIKLPKNPGVYLMKDETGEVIYVGKAKNLKNRVSQYFRKTENHSIRIKCMINKIYDFNYILTNTELEALLLECSLIKKFTPKYNILLKDGKTYPYIKCLVNIEFPYFEITKKYELDGSIYKGPYSSTFVAEVLMQTVKELFKIKDCKKNKNLKPCLYWQIGHCSAPCANKITALKYKECFKTAMKALDPPFKLIVSELEKKMKFYCENLNFEKAIELKNTIFIIKKINEQQTIVFKPDYNCDVIGYYKGKFKVSIVLFEIRNGKVSNIKNFVFNNIDIPEVIVSRFVTQTYLESTTNIKEVIIPFPLIEESLLQEALYVLNGKKINFLIPKKGKKAELLKIVTLNAKESLKEILK